LDGDNGDISRFLVQIASVGMRHRRWFREQLRRAKGFSEHETAPPPLPVARIVDELKDVDRIEGHGRDRTKGLRQDVPISAHPKMSRKPWERQSAG
jgi:hypothetical protein